MGILYLERWSLWCDGAQIRSTCYWFSVRRRPWIFLQTWWSHQMETFSALLAICAGNSPVTGEFPTPRPMTRSFEISFYMRPNKRLSKQSWGWWFETPSRPLWRHGNGAVPLRWIYSGKLESIHIFCHFLTHADMVQTAENLHCQAKTRLTQSS